MKDEGDARAIKGVRTIFSRRGVDITRADVRVHKGVCQIRGYIKAIPSVSIPNIEAEVNLIAGIIRTRSDVRSVVIECTFERGG